MNSILVASPEGSAEGLSIYNLIRNAVAQHVAAAKAAHTTSEQPIVNGEEIASKCSISPATIAPILGLSGLTPIDTFTNSMDISLSCNAVFGETNEEWRTHDHVVFILDITDKNGFDTLRRHHASLVTHAFRAKKHSITTTLHVIGVTAVGKPVVVPEHAVSKWCRRKSDVGSITYYDHKTRYELFAKRLVNLAFERVQPTVVIDHEEPEETPLDYEAELRALRREEFELAMHTALEADRSSEIDSDEDDHMSVSSDPSHHSPSISTEWDEEAKLRSLIEQAFSMHRLESPSPLADGCRTASHSFAYPTAGLPPSRGLKHRGVSMTSTPHRPTRPAQSASLPPSRCMTPGRDPSPDCVSSLACRSNDSGVQTKTRPTALSREGSPRSSLLSFLSRNGSPRPQSPAGAQVPHKARWFRFI